MYDSMWLFFDARNMAHMLEFSNKYAAKSYSIDPSKFDRVLFANEFLTSDLRADWMDEGNSRYCSQSAYDSFCEYISKSCDNTVERFISDTGDNIEDMLLYWVGNTITRIRYKANLSMRDTLRVLSLQDLIDYYYPWHELSFSQVWDRVKDVFTKI